METGKTGALVSLSSVPLIMTLGNSMLIPILPALADKLQVSSFQISLIITVYSLVAIVLIPIAGYLSDRFGRKKVMIPSLILAGAGGAICGMASFFSGNGYSLIIWGRLLQGIGAAGAAPIVLPLVGDLFKKESDISTGLGIIETSNTFGKVLSPILGSLLAIISWYAPFYAIPVLCLISILLVGFLVKVPKTENSNSIMKFPQFWKSIQAIFREKGRWLIAVFAIGGICMFVVFSALFYLSNLLEDQYGIKGVYKGCLLAVPLAALCLSSYITGKIIGENKPLMKWITLGSLVLLSGALIMCGWLNPSSLILLLLLLSLTGIGVGAALPSLDALITEGIEKEQRGTITSLYSSMRFIGVAAGPPAASILMDISSRTLFYSVSGTGVAAALLALLAIRPGKQKSTA
ncbi:MFS transporter [Paenibacillus radicis (ex Xue et al. 2023)]|uniref:MFS transporter n=1 Tax=Paenibacillus radicis (ex Xue et al. 2023) TaxID=2972489 RepID=A0ABT1YEZ1_9BACL|nr:MFS transporter [Paenibacillus radicis (ex Xue et al. 2023)]MCR8631762.1 MFS transporter [Paenibacillus radicis (ex Xue et al. 2023)]